MKSLIFIFFALTFSSHIFACTNVIVTKGASRDGSAFLAYTNDAEYIYHLYRKPASDHAKGSVLEYFNSEYDIRGTIPQVPHTYAILGFHQNEHQLSIGETTFTGRLELWNHSKYLQYWHLMELALERAKTAREAIDVITSLVETYGYASEGESFSIVDKNEAWILEMVGTGTGGEGAVWVAVKIPDGMISAHANKARIGEFPLNDPKNCVYSKNVISFAIEKGYYNPATDGAFKFNDTYCPPTPGNLRYCESRVWSIFRRAAPSLNLKPDFHRGVKGAHRYPLYIKPDKPLELSDVLSLIRDHYEDTEIDMTKGFDAGPYGNPNRNRPLLWETDSVQCSWERPISTFNTAFSFVAQMRDYLPNPVGGLIWFGVDDTYFSCFIPIYNCTNEIPKPFATGNLKKFDWESAWWTFNFVSNYANLRYDAMTPEIVKVQDSLEQIYLAKQHELEQTAVQLINSKKQNEAEQLLTNYSITQTSEMMQRWQNLAYYLITKYNDGYIKTPDGNPEQVGYPQEYLRNTLKYRPKVALPDWNKEASDNREGNF